MSLFARIFKNAIKNVIIEGQNIKFMGCFMAFSLQGSVSGELPRKGASVTLSRNVRVSPKNPPGSM